MVIMASGIACGRVRTTATMAMEFCNMAAILQIMGWQRHAALVYCVLLWYWISKLWSIDTCQNKVSADQFHVTISQAQVCSSSRSSIFWSWPLTKCWFFDWIAVSCLVNSLKTGTIVALFCIWWLLKLKIEGKTIYRKPLQKTSAKNFTKLKSKFYFFLG